MPTMFGQRPLPRSSVILLIDQQTEWQNEWSITLHCQPSWSNDNCSQLTLILRALFPILSSGGDQRHKPIRFGTTTKMQPEIADFAGSPTLNAKSPEYSYMPHDCISNSVLRTDVGLSKSSPVTGQHPPLASVAAITAPVSTVISIEHNWRTHKLLLMTSSHHHHHHVRLLSRWLTAI